MDTKAFLESLKGFGDRNVDPSPEDVVKLCAALVWENGLALHARSIDMISHPVLQQADALMKAGERLFEMPVQLIIDQLREIVARRDSVRVCRPNDGAPVDD